MYKYKIFNILSSLNLFFQKVFLYLIQNYRRQKMISCSQTIWRCFLERKKCIVYDAVKDYFLKASEVHVLSFQISIDCINFTTRVNTIDIFYKYINAMIKVVNNHKSIQKIKNRKLGQKMSIIISIKGKIIQKKTIEIEIWQIQKMQDIIDQINIKWEKIIEQNLHLYNLSKSLLLIYNNQNIQNKKTNNLNIDHLLAAICKYLLNQKTNQINLNIQNQDQDEKQFTNTDCQQNIFIQLNNQKQLQQKKKDKEKYLWEKKSNSPLALVCNQVLNFNPKCYLQNRFIIKKIASRLVQITAIQMLTGYRVLINKIMPNKDGNINNPVSIEIQHMDNCSQIDELNDTRSQEQLEPQNGKNRDDKNTKIPSNIIQYNQIEIEDKEYNKILSYQEQSQQSLKINQQDINSLHSFSIRQQSNSSSSKYLENYQQLNSLIQEIIQSEIYTSANDKKEIYFLNQQDSQNQFSSQISQVIIDSDSLSNQTIEDKSHQVTPSMQISQYEYPANKSEIIYQKNSSDDQEVNQNKENSHIPPLIINIQESKDKSNKNQYQPQIVSWLSIKEEQKIKVQNQSQLASSQSIKSENKIKNQNQSQIASSIIGGISQNQQILPDNYLPVGLIVSIWPAVGSKRIQTATSTAFLISKNELITCHHALFDGNLNRCRQFIFIPGCKAKVKENYYRHIKMQECFMRTTFQDKQIGTNKTSQQFVILHMNVSIHLKFYLNLHNGQFIDKEIRIVGYPESKIWYNPYTFRLKIVYAPRKDVEGQYISLNYAALVVHHQVSTARGMSGGPILSKYKNKNGQIQWRVIGIHTQGRLVQQQNNQGMFIATDLMIQTIKQFRKQISSQAKENNQLNSKYSQLSNE